MAAVQEQPRDTALHRAILVLLVLRVQLITLPAYHVELVACQVREGFARSVFLIPIQRQE